jgi:hypothetical protein
VADAPPAVSAGLSRPSTPAGRPRSGDLPGDGIIWYLVSANLEVRFHSLLEAVPDAIVGCDRERRIRLVNTRAEALFGYDRNDIVARPLDLVFPGHRGFLDVVTGEVKRPDPGQPGLEVAALRLDGSAFPAEVTVTRVDTTSGPLAIVAVRDVTERRRAASEMERMLERERRAAKRLRSLDSLKDEFLSTVSHELRTPLTSISGFVHLLLDERGRRDEALRRQLLERVSHNASEMVRMVEQILDYSRMEAGRVDLQPERIDLLTAAARCAEGLGDALRGHVVSLDVVPGASAFVDPQALERILGNLLTNAAKYSPDTSPIFLTASVAPGEALVQVRDQGSGIPVEDRPHLFDRFFRGAALATGRRGTGIGLSIVHRYVSLSGGRVWFDEPVDGGSQFSFTLPAVEPGSQP